jgi:hypothetical protein
MMFNIITYKYICEVHGEVEAYISSSIERYSGEFCQCCILDILFNLGLKPLRKEEVDREINHET